MIPYGRQNLSDADIKAVIEVLKSDFLTQGPVVPKFENAVCKYTGATYALTATSGTSALHLACMALNLSPGDWLWTTPISFVASANCGLYCGAKVDFVDIDPLTWNMSVDSLSEKLIIAEKEGRLPKVVIPVHLAGLSCHMKDIAILAERYGFHVIEDASHALGGQYDGSPVGACTYSDAVVFSFHPVKNITTGEGGMVLTNDLEIATRVKLLRTHGIIKTETTFDTLENSPWYYEQTELGFNYRMTDIQAALGCSQLGRLDYFISVRNEICQKYRQAFSSLPVKIQASPAGSVSGNHLFIIRLMLNQTKQSHAQIYSALKEQGINVNLHYIPIYRHPFYRKMGFEFSDFPEAEAYYSEAITLPVFYDFDNETQDYVIQTLSGMLL